MCGIRWSQLARRSTLAVAIALTAACQARGQTRSEGSWIGRKVITKLGVSLRAGNGVVDDHKIYHTYKIVRVENGWLWLESQYRFDVKGYALPSEVIPRESALEYYNSVIKAEPRNARAYLLRGHHLRVDRKAFDEAIKDYDRALELMPEWASAYNSRGNTWFAKHEYDKAIEDYGRAMQLAPRDVWPRNNRGNAYRKKKEYAKAVDDWREAQRMDPKNPLPYANIAWLTATCPLKKHRDGKRALRLATQACELSGWRDGYCLGTLAAAYAELGDFRRAVAYQEKANQIYPGEVDRKRGQARLKLYRDQKPYRDEEP